MADTKQNITELPVKIASGIAATDYLLGIDAGEGYQMLIQDLGDYIIQNATSALGGAAAETLVDALARKVPAPDEDGTAGQVLRTNGDGTTEWEDNASAEEIAADVTDWLDEHVAGGTTLAIDNTLTISGAAADSKAAGDRIEAVGDTVDDLSGTVETLSGTVETLSDTKAPAIYSTASGALVTFPDGADDMPIKSLTVGIEPVQAGSGDPSPENVRPITGWAGVKVARTGKNLLGGSSLLDRFKAANIPGFSYTDEVLNYGAANMTGKTVINNFPFKENTQYTFIIVCANSNASKATNLAVVYADGTSYHMTTPTAVANTKQTAVYTTTAGKTVSYVGGGNYSGTIDLYYNESGIFEGELTADDFTPYTGDTYGITLPTSAGTVYGGTLDVTKGTLTVDRAMVDLGTLIWSLGKRNNADTGYIFSKNFASIAVNSSPVCEKYALQRTGTFPWEALNKGCFGVNGNILVFCDDYANAAAFKTAVTGTHLVYELATPQTYTLTPQSIRTLLGINTMWADCGDIEDVTYPADTKLYIDGLTQPDSDMVADANIQIGKYFSVNNKLYLATAAIAAGEAIVPGTNCAETSLADALNTINS